MIETLAKTNVSMHLEKYVRKVFAAYYHIFHIITIFSGELSKRKAGNKKNMKERRSFIQKNSWFVLHL